MIRSAARLLVVAAAIAATTPVLTSSEVAAAPGDANEIVAVVVDGVGNGHGRGLSQWGSYGWAVNYGWDWTQILDHYYGGTTMGDVSNDRITVRLLALDDQQTAVISATGTANWSGGSGNYYALVAREVGSQYQVYGSTTAGTSCPPPADEALPADWVLLGQTGAPHTGAPGVAFTTPAGDDPGTAPGDVLGVCGAGGIVDHYRGSIYAANGTAGENRTVNSVLIESYLRGVVPRESPASWGAAGGGAGANALRAQSVAARSYALTQARYSYAQTCDSSACQVYGGAGWRVSASSTSATSREHELTDAAIAATAGKVRRWPSTGQIVSTEFSASNGPRTAGGSFPAVDDPADSEPANPLHRWTRVIDAGALATKFDLGTLTAAFTERDPATQWDGQWGNRVQLQGTAGSTVMSALSFRGSYGLPSHGISIRVITREMVTPQDFAFIGDSVGFSITDSDTSELPALLDGVFASTVFDSVGGRCTAATELHRHHWRPGGAGHPERDRDRDRRARLQRPEQLRGKDRPGHDRPPRQGRDPRRLGHDVGAPGLVGSGVRGRQPGVERGAGRAGPNSSCSTGTRPAAEPTATAGTPTASISPTPGSRSSPCGCAARRSRWRRPAPASSAPGASCG